MKKGTEKLLDIKSASKYLCVPVSNLRSKVFYKEIPFVKVGRLVRFYKSDLDAILLSGKKCAVNQSMADNTVRNYKSQHKTTVKAKRTKSGHSSGYLADVARYKSHLGIYDMLQKELYEIMKVLEYAKNNLDV